MGAVGMLVLVRVLVRVLLLLSRGVAVASQCLHREAARLQEGREGGRRHVGEREGRDGDAP